MRIFLFIATLLLLAAIATILWIVQPPALMTALGLDEQKKPVRQIEHTEGGTRTKAKGGDIIRKEGGSRADSPPSLSSNSRYQSEATSRTAIPLANGRTAQSKETAMTTGKDSPEIIKVAPLPPPEFEPDEVIVSDPPKGFTDIVRTLQFTIREKSNLTNLGLAVYRLRIPTGMTVKEAVRQLKAKMPGITVDANHYFEPGSGRLNVRDQMGWPEAPATCGRNLKIGMIDSSVDLTHPALSHQRITFRSFHRSGRKPGPADHGTAVAAIIVGRPDWGGLVPGAHLYAANMFEMGPAGKKVGTVIGLLKSFNWIMGEKVRVINLSIAGSDNQILRKAMQIAREHNVIMVAAAGNKGEDAPPAYPAGYGDVIAVTAITSQKTIYNYANQGDYIEYAAPGVNLWTAVPGGGRFQSGTSFASPYIATLIASQIAQTGQADLKIVRETLVKIAKDLGPKGHDRIFGWGMINQQPLCP